MEDMLEAVGVLESDLDAPEEELRVQLLAEELREAIRRKLVRDE